MKRKYTLSILLFIIVTILVINSSYSLTNKKEANIIENHNGELIPSDDKVTPDIILTGSDITIKCNDEYLEPGYKAIDNIDGDITDRVIIDSNLNNKIPGEYEIKYFVVDSSNNKKEVKRKVTVKKEKIMTINYANTQTENDEILKKIDEINDYLSHYNLSVGYYNLDNNFTYLFNEKKTYFGASLIKTLDAMYIYENTKITKKDKEKVASAISKSSNSAHAYLLNKISIETLNDYSVSLGASPLKSCQNGFCDTTVQDQITYLRHLYELIKNNSYGEELKSYFINDYGNYLSYDYTYQNIHKYGNSASYYHDVGIFENDSPYIIVVLTKEKDKGYYYMRDLIVEISSKINDLNNLVKEIN